MASVHRLIFWCLLALSALHTPPSFASFPAPATTVYYGLGGYVSTAGYVDTCDHNAVVLKASDTRSWRGLVTFTSYCEVQVLNGSAWSGVWGPNPINSGSQNICPANSTGTTTCTCNSGSNQVGSTCVPGPSAQELKCTAASGGADLFTSSAYRPVGGAYCPTGGDASGCGSSVTGGYATVQNGVKTWVTEVTYNGTVCTPPAAGTSTATDAPTACKGQQGTVNGVSVCIPFSESNPPAETVTGTTTTAADGTKVTTVDETKCNGATCTTTTTETTTAAGGGTSTTSTTAQTEPQGAFCQENPNSPMCKSGAFSDSGCVAPPVCDGDAIACGIAQQTWKTACALLPSANAESALYDSQKSLTGSQVPDGGTVSLSLGATTDLLNGAGAGGVQDQTIQIWGNSFTVPLSNVNGPLAMIGNIFLAVCFIVAVRIVREG